MKKKTLQLDAPFYAWDCISLSIKNKWDIYLIIKNEQVMTDCLKFLIYKMESIDGKRGTAAALKEYLYNKEIRKLSNTKA